MKQLQRYSYVTIVPFEKTLFYATALPLDTKLSKALIALNYKARAPFNDPFIISYRSGERLYLWFARERFGSAVVIPESFLLFLHLRKKYRDAVVVIDAAVKKVLVIRNGVLEAAFVSDKSDETLLAVAKDEYGVTRSVTVSAQEYADIASNLIALVQPGHLLRFSQVSWDRRTLLRLFEKRLLYPVVGMIALYMGVSYLQAWSMQREVARLEETLYRLKATNAPLKKAIREYNDRIGRFNAFAAQELVVPSAFRILRSVYGVIGPEDKARLQLVSVEGRTLQLRLETDENPVKYLDRLGKTAYVENVIIQNSYARRSAPKLIVYAIDLKTTQEVVHEQ